MKKYFSKITSMMLVLCLMLGMTVFGTTQSFAEGETWTLDVADTLYTGETGWVFVYKADDENWEDATVTNITSTDPTVVAVLKDEWYDEDDSVHYDYSVKGKKAGTATISVDYTSPGGETGTLTQTIKIKKYPYAIKSLKVNGKKVTVSKHKFYLDKKISKSKTSVKIKLTPKKGWKIVGVYGSKWTSKGKVSNVKITKKMITKGSSIKFTKKYSGMWVEVVMKKGSDYFSYDLNFYR